MLMKRVCREDCTTSFEEESVLWERSVHQPIHHPFLHPSWTESHCSKSTKSNYIWGNYENTLMTNTVVFKEGSHPFCSFSWVWPITHLSSKTARLPSLTLTTGAKPKDPASAATIYFLQPERCLSLLNPYNRQRIQNNCLFSFQKTGLCFMYVHEALPQAQA